MIKKFLLFFFLTFFVMDTCFSQEHQEKDFNQDIVKVTGGLIRGATNPETGIRHFWGVPYA